MGLYDRTMTDEEKINRLETQLRGVLTLCKNLRQMTDKTNTQMQDLIQTQETAVYIEYFTEATPLVGSVEAGRIYESVLTELSDTHGEYRPIIGYINS
jgi:hypothetical protein